MQRARCGLQRRLNDNERVLKELQAAKGILDAKSPTMEVLGRGGNARMGAGKSLQGLNLSRHHS